MAHTFSAQYSGSADEKQSCEGRHIGLATTIALRVGRGLLLLLSAAAGTVLLVRCAPGFFADEREMDGRYADAAREHMETEITQESLAALAREQVRGWMHGSLGDSRQYEVPVASLLAGRMRTSALLLAEGVWWGWLLALCTALPVSAMKKGAMACGMPFTVLLAMPAAAMGTACMLANRGGPVLVLSLLIAAREFKFLRSLLESAWRSPHLLQGRAQGLTTRALVRRHILPNVLPQLCALTTLSIVTALGALVPIEVIFTVPGIGQLAWSAVMNRDLPVLVAVSIVMAAVVGCAGMVATREAALEGV
jgi:peptide/nickel transport system permease protein